MRQRTVRKMVKRENTEIIRCIDCKYWHRDYIAVNETHGCDMMRDYTPRDGYCYKAEKIGAMK